VAETLEAFLHGARVDVAVFDVRPDYHRALLLTVEGLVPGPSASCPTRPRHLRATDHVDSSRGANIAPRAAQLSAQAG
jgi:hypothetical protein